MATIGVMPGEFGSAGRLIAVGTKRFPGGETTAYTLSAEDGTYAVRVITRFPSGNYITNYQEDGMTPDEARKVAAFYAR
jgi:hypothetical protein